MAEEPPPDELRRRAVLELRVHGVQGTPPASMLGVAPGDVHQVAGDRFTGVYRARAGVPLPHRTIPDHLAVEAYSWGGLTSGAQGLLGWVKRVGWLVLLPFAMVNLAYWARLDVGAGGPQARWGARAIRVAGLVLTVFMTLTPCVVAIDMVAWQCYRDGGAGCPVLPGALDFLVGMPAPRRIALACLVPVLGIVVLWVLSGRSLARYEEVTDRDGEQAAPEGQVLRHRHMWRGKQRTLRLQRLHLIVALATVVAFSGTHVVQTGPGWTGAWAATPYLWVVLTLAATAVLSVAATALTCVTHPSDVEHRDGVTGRFFRHEPRMLTGGLLLVQVAVVGAHLAALSVPTFADLPESGDFFGNNLWFVAAFVAITFLHLSLFVGSRMPSLVGLSVVAIVLVLAAVALRLNARSAFDGETASVSVAVVLGLWLLLALWHYRGSAPRADVAWRGSGAAIMLAAGAWVALLFTTGVVVTAANALNGEDGVSELVSGVPDDGPAGRLGGDWTAGGEVTLSNAVVLQGPQGLTVTSGVVRVDRLTVPYEGGGEEALTGGVVRPGDSARLNLPADTVAVRHSCLVVGSLDVTRPDRCSAEEPTFVSGAQVPVRGPVELVSGAERILVEVTQPPQAPLVVPQVLIWSPILQVLWLLLAALVAGAAYLVFLRRVTPRLADVSDPWVSARDAEAVRHARSAAAFAHRAEPLLDLLGVVNAPLALTLIVVSATGQAPWQLLPWTQPLATPSMYAVLGLSAALVLLGSRIRTSERTRRAVGVLWDLTTFWPRAAHPLAPPCYAERVVPELRTRIRWAMDRSADEDGLVILSGHSQGSLIVAAVASRLTDGELARLRVVTYGSQIRALYGRVFPAVAGPRAIGYLPSRPTSLTDPFPDVPAATDPEHPPPAGTLLARLGPSAWVSLFRRTDPMGYRVFGDADTDCDRVTAEVPPGDAGDPGPPVLTHGGYQHTPEYRAVVEAWVEGREPPPADTVVHPVPATTTDVPPLPRA